MPILVVSYLAALVRSRPPARDREAGYSSETVVVTALLVALAVAAVGIIAAAVINKAHGINP